MATKKMFRIDQPETHHLDSFRDEGYALFPAVLTDEGTQGLNSDIHACEQVASFMEQVDLDRIDPNQPRTMNVVPWNDKGPWSDQLFDAPLITALLHATIGPEHHFCHSTIRVTLRGAGSARFHQDNRPIDLADRHKPKVQMLYYPNGFRKGDASLAVIPGSHLINDWGTFQPNGPRENVTAELLTEHYGAQVGRAFEVEHLELPPGSTVLINARIFHGVSAKPADSPQPHRFFVNYIFKAPGSPHGETQRIPPEWLQRADPYRQKLFARPAHM